MTYNKESELKLFSETLYKNKNLASDPFEILTKTLEEIEMKGVTLKPEYLFFQKLSATLIGLKKHVGDPNYIMGQAKKILFLRAISNPSIFTEEVKAGLKEYKAVRETTITPPVLAPKEAPRGGTCSSLFR